MNLIKSPFFLVAVCIALIVCVILVPTKRQHAPANLLYNPGFEKNKLVKIDTNAIPPWGGLLKSGVDIQTGDAVPMPRSWAPNPSGGWSKAGGASLRYVSGNPGQDVHSGEHALFISSKFNVDVMSGTGFKITEDPATTGKQKSLPLKKPFSFSFYAKGDGTVSCRLYTYPVNREAYGLYKAVPAQFTLTNQWQKYQGTLEFTDPGPMYNAVFVISVAKGGATLDDMALYNTLLPDLPPISAEK